MSWQALEDGNRELAAFGLERFSSRVAYLATLRKDGAPRVHPVTPVVGEGHLFVFMYDTSPKGRDLQRDGRYALHAGVENDEGGQGEFFVTGYAALIDDPALKAVATKHAPYPVEDNHILFELNIESAFSTVYVDDKPVRQRWKKAS